MLILHPIFPTMVEVYTGTLDQIGEHLGSYHDFTELQHFLELNPGKLEDRVQSALMKDCEIKKASILSRTWNSIDNIYAEKAKDIAGRFTNYWSVYRSQCQTTNTSSI